MAKNIIVKQELHELIIQKSQHIFNTAGNIPGQVERFRLDADKAEKILERVPEVFTGAGHAEDATTFIKSLTAQIDSANEVRLKFTRPIDEVKALIKDQFDEHVIRLQAVKDTVSPRLTVWLKAEEERVAAEAAAQAAAQAAEAERLANAMRAAGDEEDAYEVERLASLVASETPASVRVRGTVGGGAGLAKRVTGQVTDGGNKVRFLAWAANNLEPADLALIVIGQKLLNKLAKKVKDGKIIPPPPGLEVIETDQARVA